MHLPTVAENKYSTCNKQHQTTTCDAHPTAADATSQHASRPESLQWIANLKAVWLGTCRVRFPVPGFPANRARRGVVEARRLESWLEGSRFAALGLPYYARVVVMAFQLCHDTRIGR
jgi:hypothetical protein